MKGYLRLIRLPNLLIIVLTQYMIRLFLMQPILNLSGMYLRMSDWEFALLVFATVCIASAGYIINDYFDVAIDTINKPNKTIVGTQVSKQTAGTLHAVLSGVGVAIGIFIAWRCKILMAGGALFALSVIALWYYSASFKSQFLIGNLLVSLLAALVVFMIPLFDLPPIISYYQKLLAQQKTDFGTTAITTLLVWTTCYSTAAFLLTMSREIIKDMEDMEGDKVFGRKTLPIVLGIKITKTIVLFSVLLVMVGVAYIMVHQYKAGDGYAFVYFLLTIQFPLLIVFIKIIYSHTKNQFHLIGNTLKWIMLFGLCFLFLFSYLLVH
jgi:4-hydroxybenzoate polyprenyltransferase